MCYKKRRKHLVLNQGSVLEQTPRDLGTLIVKARE